jgi:polyphosphate kinase 2 (PPK2 family)
MSICHTAYEDLSKSVYKTKLKKFEKKLSLTRQKLYESDKSLLITFEGPSASGKGNIISHLLRVLDPRDFNVYHMGKFNEEHILRPFLYRYFIKTPAKGYISIFDKSWYRFVLNNNDYEFYLTAKEKKHFYEDVVGFESLLLDSNSVIIKIFMSISKEEQKRRLEELENNDYLSFRVNKHDFNQNNHFDKYIKQVEDMLDRTKDFKAPWHIINANNPKTALIEILDIVTDNIENCFVSKPHKKKEPVVPILKSNNLYKNIDDTEYSKKLDNYQKLLSSILYKLYIKRTAVVIVFEGFDAAGKGGAIKRLTQRLDPRGYEVIPIKASNELEISHNYMWRFYNKLPKDGHICIFDRSWYGRVLVERVEGFCNESEWSRAYDEINSFESHIHNHGVIVLKFWLNVSKDEQLKRFKEREANPEKNYKITSEDWRNREKWDLYKLAADDMLNKTDSSYAPWHIIKADNKKYARIKVLEITTQTISKLLDFY